MGDFNHGLIQWKALESTGGEDQRFQFLIQESFLTQQVLEPTGGENVLDIVLSSQEELVDNVKIHEPLGNSDHNQIHFDINVKSESKNKKTNRRNFHKGNYKDMRKYLVKLDWNNMLITGVTINRGATVFKKNYPTLLKNYRPISLLYYFSTSNDC